MARGVGVSLCIGPSRPVSLSQIGYHIVELMILLIRLGKSSYFTLVSVRQACSVSYNIK